MVLIKCCDISNEVRPTEVAEPWVDCLLEEYFMQVTSANAVALYQNQAAVGGDLLYHMLKKTSPRMHLTERQGEV